MRRTCEFDFDAPDDISDADLLTWLQFELGEYGGMPIDHPMVYKEIQADNVRLIP